MKRSESSSEDPEDLEFSNAFSDYPWDLPPAEWWEAELEQLPNPERIRDLFGALVALGSKKVDLLEALRELKLRYAYPNIRQAFLDQKDRIEPFVKLAPLSFPRGFALKDWETMQSLATRYCQHLAHEAERLKRKPSVVADEALTSFLALVRHGTGDPQFRLVSELLRGFLDEKLTEQNLRQRASRAKQTKAKASRPQSLRRRVSRKRTAR